MKLHRKFILISNGKLPNCALLVLVMLSNSLAVKGRAMAKKGKNSQEYTKSMVCELLPCCAYDLTKSISQEFFLFGETVLAAGANTRCRYRQAAVLGTQGWSLLPESPLFASLKKYNTEKVHPPFPVKPLVVLKGGHPKLC